MYIYQQNKRKLDGTYFLYDTNLEPVQQSGSLTFLKQGLLKYCSMEMQNNIYLPIEKAEYGCHKQALKKKYIIK